MLKLFLNTFGYIDFLGVQEKGGLWNSLARKEGEIWTSYNRYKNLSQNGSL